MKKEAVIQLSLSQKHEDVPGIFNWCLSLKKNVEKVIGSQTTHISRYQVQVSIEIIMNHLSDLCLWG